jgi:hypothetical protein
MLTALLISVLLGSCASSGTYESESLEPAVSYGLFDSFEDLYYRITAETNPSVEQLSPTFPWTGILPSLRYALPAHRRRARPGVLPGAGSGTPAAGIGSDEEGRGVYGYDFTVKCKSSMRMTFSSHRTTRIPPRTFPGMTAAITGFSGNPGTIFFKPMPAHRLPKPRLP